MSESQCPWWNSPGFGKYLKIIVWPQISLSSDEQGAHTLKPSYSLWGSVHSRQTELSCVPPPCTLTRHTQALREVLLIGDTVLEHEFRLILKHSFEHVVHDVWHQCSATEIKTPQLNQKWSPTYGVVGHSSHFTPLSGASCTWWTILPWFLAILCHKTNLIALAQLRIVNFNPLAIQRYQRHLVEAYCESLTVQSA